MTSAPIATFITGDIADVVAYPLRKHFDERGWLAELFRHDEIDAEFHPAMAYISFTRPGMHRGPHEHVDQADLFCFIGPSVFNLRLWDRRSTSPTFNYVMSMDVGETNPMAVIIPKGIVHGYKNIGNVDGMVINCPNRLYMGQGRKGMVDEIRHEDNPSSPYSMD